jgi:hypothetical protein
MQIASENMIGHKEYYCRLKTNKRGFGALLNLGIF